MSYATVCGWKNKFDSGLVLIINASESGRPKSAACDELYQK